MKNIEISVIIISQVIVSINISVLTEHNVIFNIIMEIYYLSNHQIPLEKTPIKQKEKIEAKHH